jgi:hypothetical protein
VAATSEDHSIRSLQAELAKVKKDKVEEWQASIEEVKRLREVLRKRDAAWKESQISTRKPLADKSAECNVTSIEKEHITIKHDEAVEALAVFREQEK